MAIAFLITKKNEAAEVHLHYLAEHEIFTSVKQKQINRKQE
jgi:hypothetical protein